MIPLQFEQYRCSYIDSTVQQSYTQRLSLMDRPNPAAKADYLKWIAECKATAKRKQQRIEELRANDKLRNQLPV